MPNRAPPTTLNARRLSGAAGKAPSQKPTPMPQNLAATVETLAINCIQHTSYVKAWITLARAARDMLQIGTRLRNVNMSTRPMSLARVSMLMLGIGVEGAHGFLGGSRDYDDSGKVLKPPALTSDCC